MSNLQIRLFGTISVTGPGGTEISTLTPKLRAILAFLVLHEGRRLARDVLIDEFWPNATEEHARSSLNTAIWRLRRTLGTVPGGGEDYVASFDSGEVGFNSQTGVWVDSVHFESSLRAARELSSPERRSKIEQALSTYQADLLEGWYSDWAIRRREHFRSLYLEAMHELLALHRDAGDSASAVSCAVRILERDPLREDIHRQLMRLYASQGQRAEAIRRFHECRRLLRTELAVEPLDETVAVYRAIKEAKTLPREPSPASQDNPDQQVPKRVVRLLQGVHDTLGSVIAELADRKRST